MWARLDEQCLGAGNGCDVLAIPRNANLSNGWQFRRLPGRHGRGGGRPVPCPHGALVRGLPAQGDSECVNGLSGLLGAEDALCRFEDFSRDDADDCEGEPEPGHDGERMRDRLDTLQGISRPDSRRRPASA